MELKIVGKSSVADFETIQAAVDSFANSPSQLAKKIVILEGYYQENVCNRLSNIIFLGIGQVIIDAKLSAQLVDDNNQPLTTFRTATFFIEGENIQLENLIIKNSAGPGHKVAQAVALFNYGHNTSLLNCRLEGHQDTLCMGPLPDKQKDGTDFLTPIHKIRTHCYQTYYQTYIEGTIDFIFGGAEAFFTDCQLHSLATDKGGYITAASTPKNQQAGLTFNQCYLTADERVTKVYLGRPWRSYAKTIFEECVYGNHIAEEGWDLWGDPQNADTIVCEEINCFGTFNSRPEWVKISQK